MYVNGGLSPAASIDVTGAVNSVLSVSGPVLGDVSVQGGVAELAAISLGGTCYASQVGNVYGTVSVGSPTGPIDGRVSIAGSISQYEELLGRLDIGGTVSSTGVVQIGESFYWEGFGNVAGAVSVNGLDGALYVRGTVANLASVDITSAVGSSGIAQIGALDDAGSTGDVAGTVNVADLNGSLTVKGSITSSGDVELTGGLDSAGHVQIGDPNDPNSGDVLGLLQISGDVSQPTVPDAARIAIRGDVGDFQASGQVLLEGDLAAGLEIGGSVVLALGGESVVQINGNVTYAGHVLVGGDLGGALYVKPDPEDPNGSPGDLQGYVHVGNDVSGLIEVYGRMGDPNDPNLPFAGHIRVDGGLAESEVPSLRVWVHRWYDEHGHYIIGPTSYIAVDYDATGDPWGHNAAVAVGDPNDPNNVFTGNTPDKHIWRVTRCRGDVFNDGAVNFADINPFVMALNDPTLYALTFPGLGDSRVMHGDCDCNEQFNFGDINSFVALLFQPCSYCSMGDNEDGGAGEDDDSGQLSPEELAAQLAASVLPELYDELLDFVGNVINGQEDEAKEYWEAVYVALTE